jgi:hypothetical protein
MKKEILVRLGVSGQMDAVTVLDTNTSSFMLDPNLHNQCVIARPQLFSPIIQKLLSFLKKQTQKMNDGWKWRWECKI